MTEYFGRDGKPITQQEWITGLSDLDKKRVAYDEAAPGVNVSTVWLGLNHQYGDGPPLIFETMVFGGPLDQEMYRYSTEEEAVTGHADMCERVRLAHCDFGIMPQP